MLTLRQQKKSFYLRHLPNQKSTRLFSDKEQYLHSTKQVARVKSSENSQQKKFLISLRFYLKTQFFHWVNL